MLGDLASYDAELNSLNLGVEAFAVVVRLVLISPLLMFILVLIHFQGLINRVFNFFIITCRGLYPHVVFS